MIETEIIENEVDEIDTEEIINNLIDEYDVDAEKKLNEMIGLKNVKTNINRIIISR